MTPGYDDIRVGHCQDCKHWRRCSPDSGYCEGVSYSDEPDFDQAAPFWIEYTAVPLMTRAEFGCAMWTEK